MAATTISTGLMVGGGLLTYAAAGLVRAMRRQAGLQQLFEAATTSTRATANTKDSGPEFDQQKQTFSRTDGDGLYEFKWWGSDKLTEKEPEITIHRHKQAHGFYLLGKETRYTTPAYVSVGNGVMMPVGGGRPYEVEKTLYSLFLARKEGVHNSAYSYSRYTNYRCTGGNYLPVVYDTKLNSLNFREVVKYIDNMCLDYYISAAATSSYPAQKDATTSTAIVPSAGGAPSIVPSAGGAPSIVPSAGNDPAGNLYVFLDNQLDIGQRVVEYDSSHPDDKGVLDSRPIFFARFKAMRHFNNYNGYYARDINDIFWRYGMDARYPLTFISGILGSWLTWYNW
jgi:hypothetical protein